MSDEEATTPGKSTPFSGVPVEITVSVGQARPTIKELLDLTESSVLTLDKTVDAAVDLMVGDRLIGRGQLEFDEGDSQQNLSVRITEIIQPTEVSF